MKYLIILFLLFTFELVYFKVADKFNIIDKPNLRSSHTHITLRGGGVIFLIGAWAWTAFFGIEYPWFLIGLSAISLISFADDVHSIPNRLRIVVHFSAMLLMFHQWGILNIDSWWIIILALVFCTGIINAYNFMDGINGITGGYSLAVLLPLLLINDSVNFVAESLLIVTTLSVFVFCIFNFKKRAKCFAGDVGAVSIAFILLFAIGALILKTGNIWYIMFLAIYGADSILTIVHRIMLGENIFEAHRKHAYQLMANELKIPHIVVSSIYMALQLVISLGLIYLPVANWIYSISILAVLIIAYVMFMKKYFHLHLEYLKSKQS